MQVLVLNPGSSTLKAAFVLTDSGAVMDAATIEWAAGDEDAAELVASALQRLTIQTADAVGYRVVHGGSRYLAPTRVDDELIDAVVGLDALAPLHNRRAGMIMRAGLNLLPHLPHVACFDTAFHANLPEEAWRYPLPADWVEPLSIRRYGFHGLSVAWSVHRAAELLERRSEDVALVVAHLGSGCSVTAVDGGRSVDTSMGYTPYEGLMMGTRSGSIDPGILLRLVRDGVGSDELADGLAHRSGLLAIGGNASTSELERRAAAGEERARLALAMFSRRAAASIAAAATALRRVDALVFTGGIGEHSSSVRGDIVRRLGSLGMPAHLDDADGDAVVARGAVSILVVQAREDRIIASQVADLLRPGAPSGEG